MVKSKKIEMPESHGDIISVGFRPKLTVGFCWKPENVDKFRMVEDRVLIKEVVAVVQKQRMGNYRGPTAD
jgi:hypothetical protein